jgi:NTP pyrophosphatase (non-canonical NTP hydrolase)
MIGIQMKDESQEMQQLLFDFHGPQKEPEPLTSHEVTKLVTTSEVVAKLPDAPVDPMPNDDKILWGYHPPTPAVDYVELRDHLNAMQRHIARWKRECFPRKDNVDILFKGVVEEVGELSHAFRCQEQGIRGTFAEHEAKAKDAVGDIIVFLADLCNKKSWDLGEIVQQTWLEVSKRDWVKFPKNGLTE